jgi:hypothetical protein
MTIEHALIAGAWVAMIVDLTMIGYRWLAKRRTRSAQ